MRASFQSIFETRVAQPGALGSEQQGLRRAPLALVKELSRSSRQLFQWINVRDAERREVAFVGREDGEAAHRGRGGDGDVLETGIMRPRPGEDRSCLAGFVDTER